MVIYRMLKKEYCDWAKEFIGLKKGEYVIKEEKDNKVNLEDFQDNLE